VKVLALYLHLAQLAKHRADKLIAFIHHLNQTADGYSGLF
jgi:hypothetical protein